MGDAGRNIHRIGHSLIAAGELIDEFVQETEGLEAIWDMQARAEQGIADVLECVTTGARKDLEKMRDERAATAVLGATLGLSAS